jgi:outer membrane protein insertion porin family
VYVRRINVTGNTRTRDEVIRREMRQLEGGWYSASKIQNSKQRVDRLGYFADVSVETPSVPGTTDQVDLNVNVVEKPTGSVLFGAGFGSEGVVLSGGVTQQNVFGSGNHIGVQINSSKINTVYSLSFTQPYWTVDGVSRGFDVYHRKSNPAALGLGLYETSTTGAQARIGIPFTDIDSISLGGGYEDTSITAFDGAPLQITNYVNTFGTNNTAVLGTLGWNRDTRDSAIYPTKGASSRAYVETGLPGGTLRFYKVSAEHKRYIPLTQTFVAYINAEVGYGGGYNGKPLPFFRNYYTGGPTSVRGFYPANIGPKDINGDPTGGPRKLVGNLELLFPVPGMPNDKSIRMSTFVDAGMIGDTYAFDQTRASVGIAVSYVSPFGPLKMSFAQPVKTGDGDKKQKIQFQFGQQF